MAPRTTETNAPAVLLATRQLRTGSQIRFWFPPESEQSGHGVGETGESLWAFTRRRRDSQYVLAAELIVRAITRNPPNYRYGNWRAWGDLANMALVCPNHHAAIHRDDAAFDYGDLAFVYSNGLRERLKANQHLPAA